jgi:hypothetical protein
MNRKRAIEITKEMWGRIAEIKDFSNFVSIPDIKQDTLSNMLKEGHISSQEMDALKQNYECAFCTLYLDSDCLGCPGKPLWGKPEDIDDNDEYEFTLCERSTKSPYSKIHRVFHKYSISTSTRISDLYEMSKLIRKWAREIANFDYK